MDNYYFQKKSGIENYKNKKNKKKSNKYMCRRSKKSPGKILRNKQKGKINNLIKTKDFDTFICLFIKNEKTYTWWDCKPYKPKVY